MGIKFKKVSDFNRGIIFELLKDAYSYDDRNEQCWGLSWKEFDDFFFDNLHIADKYGFITTLDNEAIGMISWDPRNIPEYVEIGHNCISSKYKGKGYGKMQLQEAINRIKEYNVKRIIVTTNTAFASARKNYESVGFTEYQQRKNDGIADFTGEYIDYMIIKNASNV